MALGKTSKKTQKPAGEPKTRAASTGTKAKASQTSSAASAFDVVEAAPLQTREKSTAVVNLASAGQNDVVTPADLTGGKTMAAAVGSSALDATSLESVPATSVKTVSVGHSAVPSNGTAHAPARDAIAQLAFSYWAERGYAHGYAEEDWARAEAELNGHR